MLEKARTDGHVLRHLGLALLDGAHGVRDFEARVPEHANVALDRCRIGAGFERPRQKDQDIDVGVGKELAAAVAAYRDQRGAARWADLEPEPANDAIDQRRLPHQQALRLWIGDERRLQRGASGDELTLPAADARIGGGRGRRGARRSHAKRQVCANAGAGGAPSETVTLRSRRP